MIDEAHLNFGASAEAAAKFYLNTLRPDFTLLATATPHDDKLDDFEKKAGIEVPSRVTINRDSVVQAGLNKVGLMLGVLRIKPDDLDLIDMESATLTAGWMQHQRIIDRLAERDIDLTPLMLVQVEDQARGGEDPVERVRAKLTDIGVPDAAIAVHTSGKPDPDFHMLAYDPDKQVLIFKVAVATGFDAPRAWTLVSVRPNRGKEFGLQIVGRIMRVHPALRATHGMDPLLDRGYVFLTDPEMQTGLDAAAAELKAVRESVALLTDSLDVVEFGNTEQVPGLSDREARPFAPASPPVDDEERQRRLAALIESGIVKSSISERSTEDIDRAIATGDAYRSANDTPLFSGELPMDKGPDKDAERTLVPSEKAYPLRIDLGVPAALWQEKMPELGDYDGIYADFARIFCEQSDILRLLHRKMSLAQAELTDLFVVEDARRTLDLKLKLSAARIAERAQLAFNFNNSLDPAQLKRALVAQLRHAAEEQGMDVSENDLRRAVDLAAMTDPGTLKDCLRKAQAGHVTIDNTHRIPDPLVGPETLDEARRSAHGVFPHRLNIEERKFAEFLDSDDSGTVLWWLRNPENERWATRMILPSGKRFFPDFIVGVSRRTTTDNIALVEIKDDGETGRLQADRNIEKIRVQHREYKNVFWSYRQQDEKWVKARFDEGLHRILPSGQFKIGDMIYIS